jgi:hypothetical protein
MRVTSQARGKRVLRAHPITGGSILLPITRFQAGLDAHDALIGSDYLVTPAEAREAVAAGRAVDHVAAGSYTVFHEAR